MKAVFLLRGRRFLRARLVAVREGLRIWWQVACLCRENWIRRRQAAAVDRERQAVCLEVGAREDRRPGPLAPEARQRAEQAQAACRAADERRVAERAQLDELARQTASGQARCEQELAEQLADCRLALDRRRANRQDEEAAAAVESVVRRIKALRWAWQAEVARARREGERQGRALADAERAVAASEAERVLALRELGRAVFGAGGAPEDLAAPLRSLDAEWTRLDAERKQTTITLRSLARAGRLSGILLVLIPLLLLGGTLAYLGWRRASFEEKVEQITREGGRQDRDKTATEKAADSELEADALRIVE